MANSDLLTAPTDSAIAVHTSCNNAVTLSILIVCGSEKKFIKIEGQLCENALRLFFFPELPGSFRSKMKGDAHPGGGGYPYNGLYREAPPEMGTFFWLQVYERVGILIVEVYVTASLKTIRTL